MNISNTPARIKVGLDIGYSGVKLAHGSGKAPAVLNLPVGAAPIDRAAQSLDGGRSLGEGHEVMVDGQAWVAGVDPRTLDGFVRRLDESYPATPEYKALYYAALSAVGAPKVASLVTGLPVRQFQDIREREALRERLVGRHHIREGLTVEVENVTIVPQPAGAFMAHSTTEGLEPHERLRPDDTSLIIDPGHWSLDWIVYAGGFQNRSSGSTSSAGQVMIQRAAELLAAQHRIKLPEAKLERAVITRQRTLQVGNVELNFWPALEAVAGEIVDANLVQIRGSIRAVSDRLGVDVVLLTGGGASLFEGAIRKAFPDSRVAVVKDSVLANARGFFGLAGMAIGNAAKAA